MSTDPKRGSGRTVLATIGIVLLPAACCGVPLLLGAGAFGVVGAAGVLGAVGTMLGNPWVIAAAVALIAGLLVWLLRRRAGAKRPADDCCVPERPASARDSADQLDRHQR